MRVCSLFSSIGEIDLGFIQTGFEIVWVNEFDEYAKPFWKFDSYRKKSVIIPT